MGIFRITIHFTILYLAGIRSCLGNSSELAVHDRVRRGYLSGESRLYIGSVRPHDWVIRMEIARTNYLYASDHPGCVIANIGKRKFRAKMIYGSVAKWFYDDPLIHVTVEPGERKTLTAYGYLAATVVEVVNDEDVRAIFYASRGTTPRGLNQPPTVWQYVVYFDSAMAKVLQIFVNVQLVGNAYSHSFATGVAAEMLYDVVFPSSDTDAWLQVKDKVEKTVNNAIIVTLNAILDNDIKPLKAKIKNIVSLVDNPLVHNIYVSLIHELVGYETKFYFTSSGIKKEDVNLHVLPLYVRTINMKVGLYSFGLTYQKELNLTNDEVDLITKYRKNVVFDAIEHIRLVKKEKLDYDYNNMDPDDFYEKLMKTRMQAAVHGEHYISYWLRTIDPDQPKINDTTIAYSNYFGVSTPNLYLQALVKIGEEPLSPRIIEVSKDEIRRVALKSLEFHYHGRWRREDVMCGIKLFFENDIVHILGSHGYKNHKLNLEDRRITILEVRGSSSTIDCLNFTLTDGSSNLYGHSCSNLQQTYKLEGHYISSLFISKDNGRTDSRIVNIAVSYQLFNPINSTDGEVSIPKSE